MNDVASRKSAAGGVAVPERPAVRRAIGRIPDPQHRAFVRAYLGDAQGNATEAARIAGYAEGSAHVAGHRLLRNDKIRRAIAIAADEYGLTLEETAAHLAEIATADFSECMAVDPDGHAYVDIEKVKEMGLGHLVQQIVPTKYGSTVKFYDRLKALEAWTKIHGMQQSRVVVEDTRDEDARAVAEQLQALRRAADAARARAALGTAEYPIEVPENPGEGPVST